MLVYIGVYWCTLVYIGVHWCTLKHLDAHYWCTLVNLIRVAQWAGPVMHTNERGPACDAWLVTETVAVSLVLQNLQNWSGNTQQDLCMRGANAWCVIYAYVMCQGSAATEGSILW